MSASGWERWAGRLARGIDRRVGDARSRLLGAPAARQVVVYRGFGNHSDTFLSGRVLADRPVRGSTASDNWLTNLGNTLRHLETDEVPGARVRVSMRNAVHEAVSDEEGYFRVWLRHAEPLASPALWHEAAVEVIEPLHANAPHVRATGQIIVPHADARFGVISDIDDTVIRTDATRLIRMLRQTLLENARTRLPFAGVAEFYRGLHGGVDAVTGNPVFYVSSSPWNLYSVLTEFLEHQAIPLGPLILRDWAISERGILPTRHGEHKLGAIRQILDCYPAMPFILIGDSGQEDPEIYRTIVHDYPSRIEAVYIRNVSTGPGRAQAIGKLAEEVKLAGSELLLSDDSAASAAHAAERGWMSRAALEAVVAAVSSS